MRFLRNKLAVYKNIGIYTTFSIGLGYWITNCILQQGRQSQFSVILVSRCWTIAKFLQLQTHLNRE